MSVRTILSRQRAGGLVKIRRRELDEFRKACLLTDLIDGPANQFAALLAEYDGTSCAKSWTT
jgi:hypothetical protein